MTPSRRFWARLLRAAMHLGAIEQVPWYSLAEEGHRRQDTHAPVRTTVETPAAVNKNMPLTEVSGIRTSAQPRRAAYGTYWQAVGVTPVICR